MRWTKSRTTWLGTTMERRARWYGLPVTVRGFSTRGTTARGWAVVVLVALLLLAVIVVEELLL